MTVAEITGIESLSPPAREIVETKKCAWRGSFKKCKPFFEELARFDEAMDAKRAGVKSKLILFIILAVVSVFLTIGSVAATVAMGSLGIVGAILFGALAGFSIVMIFVQGSRLSACKGMDLDNEFRLVLVPFFELIAEDVEPKEKISLDLDLAGGMAQTKKISSEKIPPGRFSKVIETIYQDPWCRLELPLVDGSVATIEIENQITLHDRHWRTRSRSGKTKFKQKKKWKKLVILSASLRPNTENLQWNAEQVRSGPASGQAGNGKQKLKTAIDKKNPICRLRTVEKFSSVGKPPTEALSPNSIMTSLMQLFSMLSETGTPEGENHA